MRSPNSTCTTTEVNIMGQKKDLKMIKKVLKKKRDLYSEAELTYLELQYNMLKLKRKAKKAAEKQSKGFQ